MNSLDLSLNKIYSAVENYTKEHYMKGADGMAEWMIESILKDTDGNLLCKCIDKNRKHLMYLDENKNEIKDIKGAKLFAIILPEVKPKAEEYKDEQTALIIEENFGPTSTDDEKIFRLKKENYKRYKDSIGSNSKLVEKLVEKIY